METGIGGRAPRDIFPPGITGGLGRIFVRGEIRRGNLADSFYSGGEKTGKNRGDSFNKKKGGPRVPGEKTGENPGKKRGGFSQTTRAKKVLHRGNFLPRGEKRRQTSGGPREIPHTWGEDAAERRGSQQARAY